MKEEDRKKFLEQLKSELALRTELSHVEAQALVDGLEQKMAGGRIYIIDTLPRVFFHDLMSRDRGSDALAVIDDPLALRMEPMHWGFDLAAPVQPAVPHPDDNAPWKPGAPRLPAFLRRQNSHHPGTRRRARKARR